MYEIYCKLRDAKGCKDSDVAKATNITKSTFSDWKSGRSVPKDEKLQKIAKYFGVSTNYLRTGKEDVADGEILIKSRDLKIEFQKIHKLLKSGETAPLYFDGQPADPNSIDLLLKQVEISLALIEKSEE